MRTRERRGIGGRQDHDRRKDDRRRAERRDLLREAAACRAGRVTRTPTPAERPGGCAGGVERMRPSRLERV